MHPAALPIADLERQCRVRFVRRSGPGGQHRNKVETGAVLEHGPTGVRAEASERRSQAENRAVALRRLRLALALEVRLPWPEDRQPSALWRARCVGQRIQIGVRHPDFPAMLAEALDAIVASGADPRPVATLLDCTPSQLVKLLGKEPRALVAVNRLRVVAGLAPLR